eukprot:CAMPEP_0197044326 /NCGR_PEP_ID=MMETSP1384-20130603/20397_1 /TAXON_ID=29189 /ORGANISM="Ammonia sp." /LENGTH=536 /DNA_ID=CAMNT_0042475763 /DNA_START=29 /DNA_END=1639 /DNA_ORIENTATION=-
MLAPVEHAAINDPLLQSHVRVHKKSPPISYASDPEYNTYGSGKKFNGKPFSASSIKSKLTNNKLLSQRKQRKYNTFDTHHYSDVLTQRRVPSSPTAHILNRRAIRRNLKYAQRLKSKKYAALTQIQNLYSIWISQLIKLDDTTEKEIQCLCNCKSYDFHKISQRFDDDEFFIFACYEDAFHFRVHSHHAVPDEDEHEEEERGGLQMIVNEKDIFVFQKEGVIVFWNLTESERTRFISLLNAFKNEYPAEEISPGILPQEDEFCYELGTDFQVENHTVTLSLLHCFDKNYIENWDDYVEEYITDTKYVDALDIKPQTQMVEMEKKLSEMHLDAEEELQHHHLEEDEEAAAAAVAAVEAAAANESFVDSLVDWKAVRGILMMQKLAVSFGVAQSSKLNIFEYRVDENIELNADIAKEMALQGSIGLNANTIVKRMGRLFIARSELNLRSDVLDTPEHFYENDMFLNEFYRIRKYLNIDKRLEVINSRFALLHELYQIVMHQQETAHGSKLEWIVIWLIVAEVILGLAELCLIWFNGED